MSQIFIRHFYLMVYTNIKHGIFNTLAPSYYKSIYIPYPVYFMHEKI